MSAARKGRTPGKTPQRAYDAFISYSHAADSRLAPALQRGLQRLTRAWYQRQALRIFRDQTSLAANPDLYATIERALRESRHFVLLASPAAAQSPWVRREVRFWQEHRERETFLIALTDGVIRWDDATGDFNWPATDALPEELRGWFPHEPLWVDLSWTRGHDPSDLTLRHGRFRDDVATLAAALHGRAKEQIDSEDARQHRRALRIGRAVVALLVLLLVIAGVENNNANTQRNIAQRQTVVAQQQKVLAQEQRALATQRALDADAQVYAATTPVTALDMSLAALRVDPSAQVRQILVNTLLHTRYQGSSQPQTPGGSAEIAAFSPNGRLLANVYSESADTVVSLWTTADPTHLSRLANLPGIGAQALVTDIAFSPDSRVLAVVVDGKIELWSPTAKPRLLSSLMLPSAQAVAFSPDGTTLAAVGGNSVNGTLETWDVANPAAPRLLARVGGVYYPQYAAFSPDGKILVTGSGEETGPGNGTITGRTRAVLWDASDLQAPRQLSTILVWYGEGGIAFGPSGKTLALSWANEVALYDIANPAAPQQLSVLVGDTQEIDAVAFSPDGRSLVTGGEQQDKILLWNTTNPSRVPQPTLLAEDSTSINALAFVPGGHSVLTADWDTQVSQWGVTDNAPSLAATLTDPANTPGYVKDYVDAVAISPDSHILAIAYYNAAVILWNVTDPTRPVELARFVTGGGPVSAVAFSPDGAMIAVGSWHNLSLWSVHDPASPQLLTTAPSPGGVLWLAFTPGSATLAGGGQPLLDGIPSGLAAGWSYLWNVSNPSDLAVVHSFSGIGSPGALSPDGKTLVLPNFTLGGNLGQSSVQVWNVTSPANPVQLPDPDTTSPLAAQPDSLSNLSDDLTFAPVRGLAATASSEQSPKTTLWSYNGHSAASQISAFTGPVDTINSLSFHPAGNLLAAASDDFTTTIWDIADVSQPFTVQSISGDTGAVNDAVFSPDGRLLVSGSEDGIAQVWTLGGLPTIAADPVGLACQITGGGFTRAQWAKYAPGIAYSASCP
jgi:WD40 repeat protein